MHLNAANVNHYINILITVKQIGDASDYHHVVTKILRGNETIPSHPRSVEIVNKFIGCPFASGIGMLSTWTIHENLVYSVRALG